MSNSRVCSICREFASWCLSGRLIHYSINSNMEDGLRTLHLNRFRPHNPNVFNRQGFIPHTVTLYWTRWFRPHNPRCVEKSVSQISTLEEAMDLDHIRYCLSRQTCSPQDDFTGWLHERLLPLSQAAHGSILGLRVQVQWLWLLMSRSRILGP